MASATAATTPSEADGGALGVRPFVSAEASVPELTLSALLIGAILGIIFGASSLYLVLRVGMTVSASIPVAVLSITLFRFLARRTGRRPATILENNVVQTTGSAGESIAFGVGVTMPALMILGYDMTVAQVMLVAALGGLLGILMMIPLRRAFIVRQHAALRYPEGTACAQVLIVGERGGASARTVFAGFGLGFAYQFLRQGLKLWRETPAHALTQFHDAEVACEVDPALLGVGYIIGPRIASITVAGGILAALVLTPMIALFGAGNPNLIFPGAQPIAAMDAGTIYANYVRYIGAGAVATGGLISLLQSLPMILGSLRSGVGDLRRRQRSSGDLPAGPMLAPRTDRDLPIWVVGIGSTALVAAIAASGLFPGAIPLSGRLAGAAMIALFGFLFVTVSSRLTGEIGSSSNPISGMTVATLLLTCLIFWLLGWIGPEYRVAALSIAGIVCVAASNGGTTSQDLKTGYLVGATPRAQQWAILVGALSSAVVIGLVLILLNQAGTIYSSKAENLPTAKANLADCPQTEAGPDGKPYHVWWIVEPKEGAPAGKYLVDDSGAAQYLVDPAINGRLETRDNGEKILRYKAPKAQLMALIIDGIMRQQLPWSLVMLGALIAVLVHLAGVSALAFAVGIYLPLATSVPIFLGGMIHALVRWVRRRRAAREAAIAAEGESESDSSPAVLLASGYIAGGPIASIGLALLALAPEGLRRALDLSERLPKVWNESPWPALGTFAVLVALLLACGLGLIFRDDSTAETSTLSTAEIAGTQGRVEDV